MTCRRRQTRCACAAPLAARRTSTSSTASISRARTLACSGCEAMFLQPVWITACSQHCSALLASEFFHHCASYRQQRGTVPAQLQAQQVRPDSEALSQRARGAPLSISSRRLAFFVMHLLPDRRTSGCRLSSALLQLGSTPAQQAAVHGTARLQLASLSASQKQGCCWQPHSSCPLQVP